MTFNGNRNKILLGVGIGAAVGLGLALSRRKPDHWSAKSLTKRVSEHTDDMAESAKDLLQRIQTIYEEGRRVVEDAAELWDHGRRLVGV